MIRHIVMALTHPMLLNILSLAFLVCSTLSTPSSQSQSPLSSNFLVENLHCPDHKYTTHIYSHSPLVIYITNFISESEAEHLETIAADKFARSSIADSTGAQLNATTRTSESASLSARDDLIRCIENRALAFQGLPTSLSAPARQRLEPLQLVKYNPGQRYHAHTDWFTSPSRAGPEVGGNRFSSFFVYVGVSDDLRGGGTRFEILDGKGYPGQQAAELGANEDVGEEWCKWVNCDEEWEKGVTFRPVKGNAVFWVNMIGEGRGDERTLHSGEPVIKGRKVGMNIWTREKAMSREYRGKD